MPFQLSTAETRGVGGHKIPILPINNGASVAFFPLGNDGATISAIEREEVEEFIFGGSEVMQLENCWLDMTSDLSNFLELNQIPVVMQEEEIDEPPPVVYPVAKQASLLLPQLIKDIGLDNGTEDEEEVQRMNASMGVLDQYIKDNTDTMDNCSMDSFASDLDSNQSLIEEVETYLQAMSGGEPTAIMIDDEKEDLATKTAIMRKEERSGGQQQQQAKITGQENSQVLKALMAGKVLATGGSGDLVAGKNGSDLTLDLTEEDLANAYTTTIKTENGQDVIIIIAQPGAGGSPAAAGRLVPDLLLSSPGDPSSLGSPAYASSSSDSEWSMSPGSNQPSLQPAKRKKYERKIRPTLKNEPYPRDKVERKKAQNRTAAFRYREKKKAEMDSWDLELAQLTEQNTALKSRLRHMEQELRCVKELMLDTGLGRYLEARPGDLF